MPLSIEDYALIGDLHTAALVGKDGSIDWLCLPHFDSDACFAALLGGPEHGRWLIAPAAEATVSRRYRDETLVLETTFTTAEGAVRVVDCMPVRDRQADLVRRVEGVSGRVEMVTEVAVRFDYGDVVPWHRRKHDAARTHADDPHTILAIAGPETAVIESPFGLDINADATVSGRFTVNAGEALDFRMAWAGPQQRLPQPVSVGLVIERTQEFWRRWARQCRYEGPYRDTVLRSLITLKALTYAPSGGIVAAPTTSLPEKLGGVRNWDYRYCWIRDATYTLLSLIEAGYADEAVAWREWLLRAVAGRPDQMQVLYGLNGERRLTEIELDWLPGYQGARPVRIGNAARKQLQLDVYGELLDALHQARRAGTPPDPDAWLLERALIDDLGTRWREPDSGIWEARGPQRHFTHSKVMAWVAVDRAIASAELFHLDAPMDQWRQLRQDVFDDVCANGFDSTAGTFTRYYGSTSLDAANLLIAPVGFLPPDDPRVLGTVAAIERELMRDGFVQRYTHTDTEEVDGLPQGEGAFLACTFWLADNYLLQGREVEGRALFERLLGLTNDVGLLSEEYDVASGRLLGNFPQALSHIQLVSTALALDSGRGPATRRSRRHREA
jgi:GH15 family glucan-1,4-alpha-glucosidase